MMASRAGNVFFIRNTAPRGDARYRFSTKYLLMQNPTATALLAHPPLFEGGAASPSPLFPQQDNEQHEHRNHENERDERIPVQRVGAAANAPVRPDHLRRR